MIRRITTLGVMVIALLLVATAAFAHECYNASRSDTGQQQAANGQALVSYEELITQVLCPEGAAIVEAAVASSEFETEGTVVNAHAVMGRGAHERGKKATDGHDIDYLPPHILAALGAAFGTCSGG